MAVVVLLALVVGLSFTPQAAQWGRDWAVRQVAQLWELDLVASRLRVNVLTRRAVLEDVRLSAPGHADEPFFTAGRVAVTLPWAVFRGRLQLTALEVDGGRVLLVREGGALVNLPPPSGKAPPEVPRRLDVRGLDLRGVAIDYVDRTGDVEVSVTDLTAALDERDVRIFSGASGVLRASGLRVRMGQQSTASGPIEGRMAFDGSNVSLQALTLPLPEARVTVDGRINRVLDDTRFALTLGGTFDVASIAAWTPPPVPVSGTGSFEGTFEGPLGGYELKAAFTSDTLAIGRTTGLPLTGTLSVTSPRLLVEPFSIAIPASSASPRRGSIDGRFSYAFGGAGPTSVAASFRDLDLDVALAAYDRDPVSFAAWLQGTVTLDRETPQATLRMRASGTSAALTRADRVAVDGRWTATVERERWHVEHDHRLLDAARAYGTVEWPAADDPEAATLSGPLTLDITDVGHVIRAARRSGIDLSESLVTVQGPAHGTFEMAGSLARLVIRGQVASSALVLPHGAPGTAEADIEYDGDTLAASRFVVGTPGGRVSGFVTMEMEPGRLAGAFEAASDDLQALAAPFQLPGTLHGTARASGTIGGTTEVPDVPFELRTTAMTFDTQPLGTLEVDGRLRGTEVEVGRLALDQSPGVVTGKGRIDYDTGAYDVSIEARDVRWAGPLPGAPFDAVTAGLTFAGAGTLAEPGGSGTLSVTPVGGHADLVGSADIRAQFAAGALQLTAFAPKLRTLAQGSVVPTAPYVFRGLAVVNALDVEPFAVVLGAPRDAVSGTVGLSTTFEGTLADLTTARAYVNLQELALSAGGLPVRLERPARLNLTIDDVAVDDLAATIGTSTLTASGRLSDVASAPLRAAFTGELSELTTLAQAFGVGQDVSASGPVTAMWESRGSLRDARAELVVSGARVAAESLPAVEGITLTAGFDGTTITVDPLSATWQGGLIEGRARVPRGLVESALGLQVAPGATTGRVDLTMRGLTQQALAPWVPAATIARLDARVSATLGLDVTSATLDGLIGTLVIDEANLTAAGVPISQARPGRLSIRGRTVSFDDVAFSAGTPVVIAGTVTAGDAAPSFDLTVTGTPGLRPFSVLASSMAVDGAAVVDLRLTGTLAAPRLDGRIDLDDAELVLRAPRVIASDVTGPIYFEGDTIRVADLRGFLNGGDFELGGRVQVLGVEVPRGSLTMQARGVAVEYPENVDSEIDALLTFSPGPGPPMLSGDVRVQRASYRAAIRLPELLALSQSRPVATQTAPTYSERVRLDLAVTTVDDIAIDNNYGRLEAGANLRLLGTVARPGATGRIDLREGGELFVLGGVYRLNESSISLTNPAVIEPELNVSAVTNASGSEQTLTLSGTLDRLSTTVTSSDADAGSDVLDLLLRTNTLRNEDALALLSGELLGVGRALGLDSLRVERGVDIDEIRQDVSGAAAENIDPSTRLTLSKRLRPDVEVIFSQDLGGGGLSAVVSYRPWRGLELRGTQRDNSDRNYAIRHQITFGGPSTAAAPRRELPRVAEVTIDGAPPADESALRRLLRLTEGDNFDFIEWREDIDRLRRWYHDRGQWEARIRASRAPRPDGTTALTYRVAPGPQTALEIDGVELSTGLRRTLEETWASAVFDRFLLDELRWLVLVDLVQRNVIGAIVDVTFTESSETRKVARIAVSDGRQVEARRVRYDGARALTPDEFDTQVTAAGLDEYIWMEPLAIVKPVTDRYYAAGYRHAVVEASPVVFENGVAVLPVAIDEGTPTTLADVSHAGVGEEMREAVAAATRLVEGDVYRDGAAEEARRRIEAAYRSRGFNRVEVTPRIAEDQTARTVSITFDVAPGPQQRLTEVVVDGAEHTRESAVVSALGLEAGTPVDYASWAQARKRVYDTNVFRQVEVQPEVVAPGTDTEAVRARVTVSEWPTWRLRYGLQLEDALTSTGDPAATGGRSQDVGVTADLQNRNVFGRAFTYGITGRAEREFSFSSTYLTFPSLFGRPIQTNVFASASREDRALIDTSPDFRDTITQLSIEQRVRRGRTFQIVYGYRVKREILAPIDPDPDDFFRQETMFGRFTGSVFTDRRDNPFDARRGWFGAINLERISEFESGADTIKLLATGYRYQTLSRVTLASAFRLGTSFLDPLVFGEEFFVGGANSIRGYAEDSAGPKNLLGFPRGGNALLVLNQEVRVPILRWARGVAFVDAGNVFTTNRDISFGALRVGYGVGLRLDTPFSIFRMDVGWPAGGGGPARWYFGLGQVF
jgi:translocation and assembly module TamA